MEGSYPSLYSASNMDTFECIATKLDIREFSNKPVPNDIKRKVLEAARLTASGINSQHWRFILVQEPSNLRKLADNSTTGKWIANANFAVIILTNPKFPFHMIDAGRVIQDMQLTAWNYGVASGIYTGMNREQMEKDFGAPPELQFTAVVGFGYPTRKIIGRKNRRPIEEIAFSEKYGERLAL